MSAAESPRLNFIDTLRLVAAGLVVFQHLAERHPARLAGPLLVLGPGVMGVVLFFLISGYVIPFSVRRGLEPGAFLIRRLCRIYPLFLAALAVVAIGGWTGLLAQWSDLRDASALRWTANLLLVQDFLGVRAILGVSWTLIIELIWYALFASALLLFRDRAARVLVLAMPAGLLVLAALSLALEMRIPLARPAMIYAAILGYQTYRYQAGEMTARQLTLASAAFFGVTWLTNFISFGIFAHPHITLAQALGPWTVAPLLFFGVVLTPAIRNAGVLSAGLLPAVGAASYSVYLLHPIANAIADQYAPTAAVVPVALALTLALSWAGYHWVEKPGIALGRALAGHRAKVPAAAET